jgi:hypothetical protein
MWLMPDSIRCATFMARAMVFEKTAAASPY